APRVPRLAPGERPPALVEVREIDDLSPARGEAIQVVAAVWNVRPRPARVRIPAHRHRPAVEDAVQPAHLTQRVPEVLLVQPPPLPARHLVTQPRAQRAHRRLPRPPPRRDTTH